MSDSTVLRCHRRAKNAVSVTAQRTHARVLSPTLAYRDVKNEVRQGNGKVKQ